MPVLSLLWCQLSVDRIRGPRIIAVAGNRGHLWGEQHRIETRTKRNHSRVNSEYLTLGGNYSRPPLYPFGNKLQFILEPINQSSNKLLMLGVGCRKKLQTPLKIIALLARFLGQLGLLAKVDSGFDYGVITSAQYRSEERRVGKECRSRWSPYH